MSLKVDTNISDIDPLLTKINANEYLLQIDSDTIQFSLKLNSMQVQQLGLKCVHFIPNIEPSLTVEKEEDVYRIPVKILKTLEDRDIQSLLRETDSSEIKQLLWYMKDTEEFTSKFLSNMSQRAAEIMRDDLASSYGEQHPDTAESYRTERARKSALNILNTANRLQRTGEISTF